MKKYLPNYLIYLFWVSIVLLLLFSAFRILLLTGQMEQLTAESAPYLWGALLNRGLLFDTSVICYIIAPVFLILSVGTIKPVRSVNYYRAAGLLVFLLSGITLLLACADIPYFKYYNSRLTNTVFVLSANDSLWLILRDLFTNPDYLPYTLLFMASIVLLWKVLLFLRRKFLPPPGLRRPKSWMQLTAFLLAGYLIFAGIRGHINPDAKPLKLEHAYFTDYTFINQLGLNATFSFIDSYRTFELKLLDDVTAIRNVQQYLQIESGYPSPLARLENEGDSAIRPNIVLVLVESLSANKMGRYGHPGNLTPYLDSLARHALTFNNIYTAGIHTHNGIYSSLTGMPAIMNNTPMFSAHTTTQPFSGLGSTLREAGYKTIFLITGKRNFDNMQGFLPLNGYDELMSKRNYPESEWINRWGIPDHCLFNHALTKIDSLATLQAPFHATIMTVSTHNPYSIPKGIDFHPTTNDPIDRSYQYADWSIGQFMKTASQRPWFNNTIFVFTGDHGQNFDPLYDMPLAYHHTPLIFYGPAYIQAGQYDDLGMQIDLFPTLMGITGQEYINNTLGINLLEEKRPFVYFSADDKLACLNEKYYLIIQKRGQEALYDYKEKSLENVITEHPELVKEMKHYTYSMLQTAQWMINNRKIGRQERQVVQTPIP